MNTAGAIGWPDDAAGVWRQALARRRAELVDAARARARRVADTTTAVARDVAATQGPALRRSAWRLLEVRSGSQAVAVFGDEIGTLLSTLGPTVVEHPLPVRSPGVARVIVGSSAASVALGEQIDAVAALVGGPAVAAPGLPVVLLGAFLSVVVEAGVAGSLHVHRLRAAGIEPESVLVGEAVRSAMAGSRSSGRHGSSRAVYVPDRHPCALPLRARGRPGDRRGVLGVGRGAHDHGHPPAPARRGA